MNKPSLRLVIDARRSGNNSITGITLVYNPAGNAWEYTDGEGIRYVVTEQK